MTTRTPTRYEQYLADYERLSTDAPVWLKDLRERGWERFQELGFPTARRGNEPWKYTNVSPIARIDFALPSRTTEPTIDEIKQAAPWLDEWINVVFVDGRYSSALSSHDTDGVQVSSLADAVTSGDSVVEDNLGQHADFFEEAFTALNTAFLSDGAVVKIPSGAEVSRPIHLLFVSSDGETPVVSHPRVLVVAGANSRSALIESYAGLGENQYFTNAVAEYLLEEGAEVEHYRLLDESDNSFHVGAARVYQGEGSVFNSKVFEKGVGLGRYDLQVMLDAPDASCDLKGLYLTSGSQHVDNYINIDHLKPNATSKLFYKGILDGKSRAIFGGTVFVREGAIGTLSQQDDKNLVLSPDAEVDSKPALFIYADDVKCGHGAAAGNIDEDTVFYMRSRGIDIEEASRYLIYGFASEIIDTVRVEELRIYLERLFLDSLPRHRFEF